MACEHASTTTLAWLYGEADEAHVVHVQGCRACQDVVADHADVASALGPALGGVRVEPTRRRRWQWASLGLAAAAAGLLFVTGPPAPPEAVIGAGVEPGVSAAIAASVPLGGPGDAFDSELEALDQELDRLTLDLEML